MLREITPPPKYPPGVPTGRPCPSCGAPLEHGAVPCPDGKYECLVAHRGYRCPRCGREWQ